MRQRVQYPRELLVFGTLARPPLALKSATLAYPGFDVFGSCTGEIPLGRSNARESVPGFVVDSNCGDLEKSEFAKRYFLRVWVLPTAVIPPAKAKSTAQVFIFACEGGECVGSFQFFDAGFFVGGHSFFLAEMRNCPAFLRCLELCLCYSEKDFYR